MHTSNQPVLVKRYAEQRLYRGDISRYLNPPPPFPPPLAGEGGVGAMAKRGEPFVVVDAKTGADVTSSFRPIIVEH
jgi:polyhydroxyalkanoate synthesis regulator protein